MQILAARIFPSSGITIEKEAGMADSDMPLQHSGLSLRIGQIFTNTSAWCMCVSWRVVFMQRWFWYALTVWGTDASACCCLARLHPWCKAFVISKAPLQCRLGNTSLDTLVLVLTGTSHHLKILHRKPAIDYLFKQALKQVTTNCDFLSGVINTCLGVIYLQVYEEWSCTGYPLTHRNLFAHCFAITHILVWGSGMYLQDQHSTLRSSVLCIVSVSVMTCEGFNRCIHNWATGGVYWHVGTGYC